CATFVAARTATEPSTSTVAISAHSGLTAPRSSRQNSTNRFRIGRLIFARLPERFPEGRLYAPRWDVTSTFSWECTRRAGILRRGAAPGAEPANSCDRIRSVVTPAGLRFALRPTEAPRAVKGANFRKHPLDRGQGRLTFFAGSARLRNDSSPHSR